MPVKFKSIQRKNPRNLEAEPKWYPQIIGDGETNLDDLAKYASSVSTVSKGDILAVLDTVFTKVAEDLNEGKIVKIGNYFTLQAGATGLPSNKEDEVNSSKIKTKHILFRPGKVFSDIIKLMTFKKI